LGDHGTKKLKQTKNRGAPVLLFAETALVSVSEAVLLFWLGAGTIFC
jgi:hypothetical protein